MTPDELTLLRADLDAATAESDRLWAAKNKASDDWYEAQCKTDHLRKAVACEEERLRWVAQFERERAAAAQPATA